MVMCGRCVRLCHSAISNVRTAATAAVGAKRLSGKVAVVTASTDGYDIPCLCVVSENSF